MKYRIALGLAFVLAPAAWAQLRTIPKEAELGQLRHLEQMLVELDGRPQPLAPGAQIRDPDNRVVLPASLVEASQVRYVRDRAGMVFRVWILSEAEKAALPPDPIPK